MAFSNEAVTKRWTNALTSVKKSFVNPSTAIFEYGDGFSDFLEPGQIAIASRGCPTNERPGDAKAEYAVVERRKMFLDTVIDSNINTVVGLMNNLEHIRKLNPESIADSESLENLTTYFPHWNSTQPTTFKMANWTYEVIPIDAFRWFHEGEYGYRMVDVTRTSPSGAIHKQLNVVHIIYRTWEDNGIPGVSSGGTMDAREETKKRQKSFYKLLRLVYKFAGYYPSPYSQGSEVRPQRLMVHCAAGIGRTGTFLTAYAYFSPINPATHSIEAIINHMRQLRGVNMVYTKQQFKFLLNMAYAVYANVDHWRDRLYPLPSTNAQYVVNFTSQYLSNNIQATSSSYQTYDMPPPPRFSSLFALSSSPATTPRRGSYGAGGMSLTSAFDKFQTAVSSAKKLDFTQPQTSTSSSNDLSHMDYEDEEDMFDSSGLGDIRLSPGYYGDRYPTSSSSSASRTSPSKRSVGGRPYNSPSAYPTTTRSSGTRLSPTYYNSQSSRTATSSGTSPYGSPRPSASSSRGSRVPIFPTQSSYTSGLVPLLDWGDDDGTENTNLSVNTIPYSTPPRGANR